jgi:RimJ/RimL family protein N-acetyltransferase
MTQRRPPRVRLRDVTLDDADALDALHLAAMTGGGFNDFGLGFEPVDRTRLALGPPRDAQRGEMLIERIADGRPIGTLFLRVVPYGPNSESNAWMIGIELEPAARGQGHGTEAQRLAAEYLFETTDAHRVEAYTDVANIAEQRALEKAGFRREGVNRGAQFRAGAYHDLVVYARLRSDWD